jgi:hypothetical protein
VGVVPVIILICLATFRITRFIAEDAFPPIAAVRDWVERRTGADSSWTYLIGCPWCVSPYVAAGVVLVVASTRRGGVPMPGLVITAASAVTGLTATNFDA